MDDSVRTLKFSQMTDGGDLSIDNKTPGLQSGVNVLFNNPLPPLPTGTTAERPPLNASMYLRLRFNTTLQSFEFYNPTLAQWIQLQDSVDVGEFPFLIYSPEPLLPNAFDLGTLSSGVLRQTVSAGVSTPAIATNGVDYYGPGFTGYFVSPSGIADVTNRPILHVNTVGINAVNYIGLTNSLTTLPVLIQPEGSDTDIRLNVYSKNTGVVAFGSRAPTNQFIFDSGTSLHHHTIFNFLDTAATRTVTWQDASGTVAYIADVGVTSITGTANQVLANGTFGSPIGGAVVLTTPQDIALTSSPQFVNLHLSGATILTPSNDELLGLFTSALPVNYFFMSASDMGDSISIGALGDDLNIDIDYAAKGTGQHGLFSENNIPLVIYSGTSNQHQTNFSFPNTANIRTVTYQDSSGTLAYTALSGGGTNANLIASNGGIVYSTAASMAILSGTATANLPLLSGSTSAPSWGSFALSLGGNLTSAAAHTMSGAFASTFTFTGVTNVTFPTSGTLATTTGTVSSVSGTANRITSTGGTAPIIDISAAYVGQSSITTLGTITTGIWNGTPIALQFGGTNANLTASNGGIVWSTATSFSVLSGTAASGRMLQSGNLASPSWSTTTYPATNAINTLMYASAANVMSVISSVNSSMFRTSSAGVPGWSASMTDGQIMIGATGGIPSPATLTVNSPLSIVNAANSITLSTAAFSSINVQIFASSGTYTPTAGMKSCEVYLYGSSGAGGGTPTAAVGNGASGSGGGSGGVGFRVFTAATIGASQTVTIGAAGTGVSNGNGNNGGSSSFGALITANGGIGGLASGAASTGGTVLGGAGGTAGTGGSTNSPGNPGFPSSWNASYALSGRGGVLNYGGAAQEVKALSSSAAGNVSSFFGGGSGSAIHGIVGANLAGGNGTAGGCFIIEYI